MIIGFKHKGLKTYFETGKTKGLRSDLIGRINTILSDMEAGQDLDALSRPSLRLHELTGDRKGTWSVSVNAQWRMTFTHDNGEFDNIDLEDYH